MKVGKRGVFIEDPCKTNSWKLPCARRLILNTGGYLPELAGTVRYIFGVNKQSRFIHGFRQKQQLNKDFLYFLAPYGRDV